MSDPSRRVNVGDPIQARGWNDILRRLDRLERAVGLTGGNPTFPALSRFRYLSSAGDVILALEMDTEGDFGTEDVPLAKPWTHRPSVTSRGSHSYTYISDFERDDLLSGVTERQVLTPGYELGDIVYATRIWNGSGVLYDDGGGLAEVTWQQVNVDGHQWAKKFGT